MLETTSSGAEKSSFIPTNGVEAIEEKAMEPDWHLVSSEETSKHFKDLPKGTTVKKRKYMQLGDMFDVREPGQDESKLYILRHGIEGFPEGEAVEW